VDREEAKRILESYRLGGKDSHDPIFSEALRELERDPELQAWFEEKERFDALMVEKLADAVTAPPYLKYEILDRQPKARTMLEKLSAQNRFALAFRIHNMKTAAGRKKKIETFVAMLKRGETIYPQIKK